VRWFDSRRGYGFLVAEDGKGDILLHVNELRAFGVPSVAEGARILVRVETTERGQQVVKVYDIRPPSTKAPPPGAGPLEPARVRWFDRDRGYGFVNVYGRREDVFLHMATLRGYGLGAVSEGDAILVRVTKGPNGLVVCEVRDWDYPNRPRGRRRSHRPIVVPESRSGRALPDDLRLRAAAAVAEMLRAGPRDRPPGQRRAGLRAGPSDSGIGANFRLGYHIGHVDILFAPVFDAR
jgi:CspA family cold shock protein